MSDSQGQRGRFQGISKNSLEAGTDGERIPHIEALSYLPGARPLIIICSGKTAHPFRIKEAKRCVVKISGKHP
jgi:hypothetical protein